MSDGRGRHEGIRGGIGFGCALAMVVSFGVNKSLGYAIVHGVLGWLYVVYYAIWGVAPK